MKVFEYLLQRIFINILYAFYETLGNVISTAMRYDFIVIILTKFETKLKIHICTKRYKKKYSYVILPFDSLFVNLYLLFVITFFQEFMMYHTHIYTAYDWRTKMFEHITQRIFINATCVLYGKLSKISIIFTKPEMNLKMYVKIVFRINIYHVLSVKYDLTEY